MESRILDRYEPALSPYEQDDLGGLEPEWVWLTEKASSMAKQYWEDAYRFEHDEHAVAFTENTLKPLIQYTCGEGDEPSLDELDEQFEKAIEDYSDLDAVQDPEYHIPTFNLIRNERGKDPAAGERLYETLRNTFENDDFDTIVGIYSGGMNSLYIASDYFDDADEILLRYSRHRWCDKRVHTTPAMDTRINTITDKDILVVDDVREEGTTMQEVSTYLHQFSPDSVTGFAHRFSQGEFSSLVDLNYHGLRETIDKWFGEKPTIRPLHPAPTRW